MEIDGSALGVFRRSAAALCGGVAHLFWPTACLMCRQPCGRTLKSLCDSCWERLCQTVSGDYCPGCGFSVSPYAVIEGKCPRCPDSELYIDGIARAGIYDGPLRDAVCLIKFRQCTELVGSVAEMMATALSASSFTERIDLFVPVPLHWRRYLERGFNQSQLLARKIRPGSRLMISNDLVRLRYTPHQWTLDTDAKRKKNVKDAFGVRRGHKFSNRTVCLVDDITTSGATLSECASVLRRAGAEKVYALVAAVAERQYI